MMSLEELFCFVDDFCLIFIPEWEKHLLKTGERCRHRTGQLTMSEQMTIFLLFQSSGYRDFKHYYLMSHHTLKYAFPHLLSYTRFVSLIPRLLLPLCALLQSIQATFDGVGFIDSTPITVCHPKRISQHKVFDKFAMLGKTTKGCFFGFKLHIICNSRGELCACRITPGNGDDRQPVRSMTQDMQGNLFGDKGYIDQSLFDDLFQQGLKLVTGIKKNMKNKLMPLLEKILLRKRGLIESVNNQLKNVFHLEHSRHRSAMNGFANMIAALIAYVFHPNKPAIKLSLFDLQSLNLA